MMIESSTHWKNVNEGGVLEQSSLRLYDPTRHQFTIRVSFGLGDRSYMLDHDEAPQ